VITPAASSKEARGGSTLAGRGIIISIEDPSVIRVILAHLGLWLARARVK